MIERQIESPMPMPLDLVVKKALNIRSAFSAEIPTPQSVTLTSTCCVPSWRDRITSSRGRSVTDCMASMPFITKLIITCCNWTRSARVMGRVGANSIRNDTRWLNNSRCTSAMISLTTSLTSSGTFSMSVLFASARTRRITSLARLPSLMIHSAARRASSRSGLPRSSQRRQATAALTTAASGWFTSWAIEAVSSPSVVTRVTWASSACALRSVSSACLRSVRSSTKATPSSWRSPNVVEQNRHAAAVFAKVLFLTRLDGSSRLQLCDGPVVGVAPFGRRQLRPSQPTRDEIFPGISDNIEKGFVGFDDPALRIPDQDPDDVRVDQAADPGLPFPKIVIQTGVLQRDRRLRRQQFQYRDPGGREHVWRQVVLEIEQPDQLGLLHQGQAEDRTGVLLTEVLICRERVLRRGVIKDHAFPRPDHGVEHGFGKFGR